MEPIIEESYMEEQSMEDSTTEEQWPPQSGTMNYVQAPPKQRAPRQIFDLVVQESELRDCSFLDESTISTFFLHLMLYRMRNILEKKMAQASLKGHFATADTPKKLSSKFYGSERPSQCWSCKKDGTKEQLVLPCGCSDASVLIHPSCLIKCTNFSYLNQCTSCHYIFEVKLTENMKQWSTDKKTLRLLLIVMFFWIVLISIPILTFLSNDMQMFYEAVAQHRYILFIISVTYFLLFGLATILFSIYWIKWRASLFCMKLKLYPGYQVN